MTAITMVAREHEVSPGLWALAWRRLRRNYVALGLEFLGLPLIGGAYLSAAGLGLANALLLRRRIADEEALLMAIPAYRLRMAHKPRFVPRLSAR